MIISSGINDYVFEAGRAEYPDLWTSARGLYPFILFPDTGRLFNPVGGDSTKKNAGHLDLTHANLSWKMRDFGRGLYFDNTENITSEVGISSPDPGFWHDSKDNFCAFILFTLELDDGGPTMLLDIGGVNNGIAFGYRTGPNTLNFLVAQNGTKVELSSSTTFTPARDTITMGGLYQAGSMELFINGRSEATGSNGTSVPAHADGPGIGAKTEATTYNTGGEDEWGGVMGALYLWDGLHRDYIPLLHDDPLAPFRPRRLIINVPSGVSTISPTGIATATEFGTHRLDTNISPLALALDTSIGLAVISEGQQILPTGLATPTTIENTNRLDVAINAIGIPTASDIGNSRIDLSLAISGLALSTNIGSEASLDNTIGPTGLALASEIGNHEAIANGLIEPASCIVGTRFGNHFVGEGEPPVGGSTLLYERRRKK